jgi:hypothetical protein
MLFINMKSRMKGDFHVRFCGRVGVKFPRVTWLWLEQCSLKCWCFITDESRSLGEGFQEQLPNYLLLRALKGVGGERKGKAETTISACANTMSWTQVNQWWGLVKAKEDVKSRQPRGFCDRVYRLPDYRVHGIWDKIGKRCIQAVIRNKWTL